VHGGGVWAPSIRFHNGEFYIYYGDPDNGVYLVKSKNPAGPWNPPILVKKSKGIIDTCPLFDEDGQVYLVHGYAGSRAGIKSILGITRLTADGEKTIGQSKIVYDGHDSDPTVEGPKFYKRNGYYYIFAPAGGVKPGWQLALRSKSVFGPYERKMVLAQGKSPINGPHQGGWVDTKTNEDWFIHFQDVGALGRVVHLQPMVWRNDWPMIGEDKDGDGCGEPVSVFRKPNVGATYPVATPAESDEFNTNELGLQWQWHSNPASWWYFSNQTRGCLSLYSVPVPIIYKNLWDVGNLLLQKMPAPNFKATTKLILKPDPRFKGERTGLLVMGLDYALLSFENTGKGFILSQNECIRADKGMAEVANQSMEITQPEIYLRIDITNGATCNFSYSLDNKEFISLGKEFKLKEGQWIGAKMGLFCTRPVKGNDGGRVDVDWFRVDK
jgi:beta-xylosidase